MKFQSSFISFALIILCTIPDLPASAAIKLPSIFTDNMVIQQKSSVAFWGWASAGKTVSVTPSWNHKTYTTKSAADGKWKLMIETPAAGGPFEISMSDGEKLVLKNILSGEVWLCSGQSNMEMPVRGFKGQPINGANETILKSANSNIRLYTVPRSSQVTQQENSKPSAWKEAEPESVASFSATAYFFGRELYELLHVPIGLINASYSSSSVETWMSASSLKPFPQIIIPGPTDSVKVPYRTPTVLYNGMIHPIAGYGIRGAIFYQGESNYDRPDEYEDLFPAMVAEWRRLWNRDSFPFYYSQIAPYNYAQLPPYHSGGKYNSAYLRDAQRKSSDHIPASGMAVLMDTGEENNIHPAAKKTAGQRLAWLALGKTYGIKGFGFESPTYDSLVVNGGIAEVKFRNAANWLTSYGKELSSFEIAGPDKIFYPAKAVIYRSSVMVSSPQVKQPVAVRYAFRDYIVGDLFSTEGLPVSSFRTDNW